jgi:hypothetical protein
LQEKSKQKLSCAVPTAMPGLKAKNMPICQFRIDRQNRGDTLGQEAEIGKSAPQ